MRRRSFLTNSALVGLGTALSQDFPNLISWPRAIDSPSKAGARLVGIRSLPEFERAGSKLKMTVVRGLDLSHLKLGFWKRAEIQSTYFLGCTFSNPEIENYLQGRNAFLLRRFDGLEYNPYRGSLYAPSDLLARTTSGATRDETIYAEYLAKGKSSPDLIEALARRIHDYSMDDGLEQLVQEIGAVNMVGITGGFFQERTDPWYRKTAETTRLLARENKFVVTGGGPGIMEAANLGAYLAAYEESALDSALAILAKAPKYTSDGWVDRALEVKVRFPKGTRSLGIPTWFYGFEPPNIFATDIAKYFDNNIREGVLMSAPKAGFVFSPGSAGARQEVFMEATQNHFGSNGYFCAMVFLGRDHYQVGTHLFQLVQELANSNYKDLLYITDSPTEAVRFIREHPPRRSTPLN